MIVSFQVYNDSLCSNYCSTTKMQLVTLSGNQHRQSDHLLKKIFIALEILIFFPTDFLPLEHKYLVAIQLKKMSWKTVEMNVSAGPFSFIT